MSNYEQWNEMLVKYFRDVSEEQLVEDAERAGIKLLKVKKFKVKGKKSIR